MSDDTYKAPSVDSVVTDNTDRRFSFRAILAVPIGLTVGVLTGAFAMVALAPGLPLYHGSGLVVWFIAVVVGIAAALFAMRLVNHRNAGRSIGREKKR